MASAISFQGLSTNLPTDQLIAAIINQQSQPMVRMQTQQATNKTKSAALQTLSADLTSLNASLDSLTLGGFQGNTVTSTDSAGTYVTASANGAAAGQYDITVKALATRARLVLPTALSPNTAVGVGDYTITDMAGKEVKVTITAGNNSLAGLAAAINNAKDSDGKASDVGAAVIQTGADGSSQLVLSAKNTGTGTAGATTFTLKPPAGSALDPTNTGSFTSSIASNSSLILNGVELHRTSNTITDAVDGLTINLNQAQLDLAKTTTLTVAQDKSAVTKAVQDVVDKYNTFYNDYKKNAKFTQNANGTYTAGVFNMDITIRNMVNQVSGALMGAPTGLPSTATFTTPAAIGLKTNQDGTLSLDSSALSDALDKDPGGVANLFKNTGSSSSPLLSFSSATEKTTSSPISFSVTSLNGVLTGIFQSQKADGTTETNTLTSTDGNFYGVNGTALEGLSVKAAEGATGTLQLSSGISQIVQSLNRHLTDSSPGDIGGIISDLNTSNHNLQLRIDQQQDFLDRSKASLQKIYSALETAVGQLQAAGQSLSGM